MEQHHDNWIKLSSKSNGHSENYFFQRITTYPTLLWNHIDADEDNGKESSSSSMSNEQKKRLFGDDDDDSGNSKERRSIFSDHTITDYLTAVAPHGGPIAMVLSNGDGDDDDNGAKQGISFYRRMKKRRLRRKKDREERDDDDSDNDEIDEVEFRRRRGRNVDSDDEDDDDDGDDNSDRDGEGGAHFSMMSGHRASSKQGLIQIFAANGKLLSRIQMHKHESAIVNIGWTSDWKLMCLTDEGKLFLFNVQGQVCSNYWNDNKDDLVLDDDLNIVINEKKRMDYFIRIPLELGESVQVSCMWDQGCAIYTTNRRLFVADDFSIKEPFEQYDLNMEMSEEKSSYIGRPVRINNDNTYMYTDMCCMAAIPAHCSPSGTTEIILSPQNCTTLVICSKYDVVDRQLYNALPKTSSSNKDENCGIKSLTVASNGATVAATLVDSEHMVHCLVFNNQIDTLYMNFGLKTSIEPTTLSFCSNDCVAVYWKSECFTNVADPFEDDLNDNALMLLIDCNGVFTHFVLENDLFISAECDGLRMYSTDKLVTLERVHSSTVSLFEIGSFEPASVLFDAYQDFCSRVPGVIDLLKDMKKQSTTVTKSSRECTTDIEILLQTVNSRTDSLKTAVECCIEAACHENDRNLQRQLLKAAIFGRTFLSQTENIVVGLTAAEIHSVIEHEYKRLFQVNEDYVINSENKKDLVRIMLSQNENAVNAFYRRCSEMRILHDVRQLVGMPLSYAQYEKLTLPSLLVRLCELHQHLLAHKICEIMNVEPDEVLKHWACVKVGSQEDDEVIYNSITSLLKGKKRISFAKIAMTAFQFGKRNLSQKLLAFDGNPRDQIPIYLQMHEVNRALETAVLSGDSDLVLVVIMYMVKYFDKKHMFEILAKSQREEVCDMYLNYCKSMNLYDDITLFHKYTQDYRSMGMNFVREAYHHLIETEIDSSKQYVTSLTKAEQCFDNAKYDTVYNALSKAQILLTHVQSMIEKEVGQPGKVSGKTAQETLLFLLTNPDIPEDKRKDWTYVIKLQFNISDKRYWYTRVQAYAHTNNWTELENLCFKGNTFRRAPPIGYEPFVEVCIQKGNETEALKYIPYVKDLENKVNFYLSLGRFKEAIECSVKDVEMLQHIRKKATNPKTIDSIDKLLSGL